MRPAKKNPKCTNVTQVTVKELIIMGKNEKTPKETSSENYFALKAEVAGSKPARGSILDYAVLFGYCYGYGGVRNFDCDFCV